MAEEKKQTKKELLIQFIKFGIVGVTNTLVSYVINVAVLFVLGRVQIFQRWDYIIANTVAFILSVLWSFYWNNKAVFKAEEGEHRNIGKALLRTYASYAFTGLFLSELLLLLWVRVLGVSEYVAPIINLLVTVPLNFIIQKFWAFRKK